MNRRAITALVTSLLVTVAWAQTASQPLNLKLPATTPYPGASANTAQPAHSSTAVPNPSAVTINGQTPSAATPGVYYGDTSGARGNHSANATGCDDSTYNQTQVHGDVGMGVVTGSHIPSGSYQSGDVSFVKNTGSCDHPTGAVGVSIGVSRFGTFGGGGFGH
jgi:hypothetical protein